MFAKLTSLITLFRKGHMVANPELWKNGQITVGAISALIFAAITFADSFGFVIPLTPAHIDAISNILLIINGLFHPVATVLSSEKVGLPSDDTDTKRNPLIGR